MKITVTSYMVNEYGYDSERSQDMEAISGEIKNSISQLGDFEGQSEDATFNRDIHCPSDYLSIIRMAYEAGKAGESLDVEFIEKKEEYIYIFTITCIIVNSVCAKFAHTH